MSSRALAQVNVALMRAPLADPAMRQFVFAFDAVARLARESPGFLWQHQTPTGHQTVSTGGGEQVVNVSAWQDYASMHAFVYRSGSSTRPDSRQRIDEATTRGSGAEQSTVDLRFGRGLDRRIRGMMLVVEAVSHAEVAVTRVRGHYRRGPWFRSHWVRSHYRSNPRTNVLAAVGIAVLVVFVIWVLSQVL